MATFEKEHEELSKEEASVENVNAGIVEDGKGGDK